MPSYNYLIIGGGMTADAAVRGIRDIDKSGSIGLISIEPNAPYNRPPLSKALWKGEPLGTIWRSTANRDVTLHLSLKAKSISVKKKAVTDDQGTEYHFDKLLIATGGSVRTLPFEVEGIIYFRTLEDYRKLRDLTEHIQQFIVVGGGFIGSEIAAALALNKKSVTIVFPDDGIGSRVFPPRLAAFVSSYYRDKGVTVLSKEGVTQIEKTGSTYSVKTNTGRTITADAIVAGLGIVPETELARSAGLNVGNGILVDEFCRTSHPDIYAAGDVANFYNPALGKRLRVEHEDNANTMGELAGKNMAGTPVPYTHLPFFYSDLFDLGYEAVGELDSRYEMVEEWKEEFKEGVVYYIHEQRVRGVLLWNTWGQVDHARSLIGEAGPFNAGNVKGRLPV